MMNVGNLADSFLKGLDLETLNTTTHSNLSTTSESLQSKASIATTEKNADEVREKCRSLVGFIREAWCHIPELATLRWR